MKKKKEKKITSEDALIGILGLILFIIFLLLLNIVEQEDFTIYKNECRNITHTFDDGDNFLCSDGSHGFMNNTNILHELNISCYVVRGEIEVCEKIEVEEIEGCFDLPEGKSIGCEGNCEPAKVCEWDCESTKNGIYHICYIKTISKKDLTKEFLENTENCKVLEWKNFHSTVFITNKDFIKCPECTIIKDSEYYDVLKSNPKYIKNFYYECWDENKYNKWTGKRGLGYECNIPIKYKCFENYYVSVK